MLVTPIRSFVELSAQPRHRRLLSETGTFNQSPEDAEPASSGSPRPPLRSLEMTDMASSITITLTTITARLRATSSQRSVWK